MKKTFTPDDIGSGFEFLQAVWAVETTTRLLSRQHARDKEMTMTQRVLLRYIIRRPGVEAAMLSEMTSLDAATISFNVRALADAGYVEQTQDMKNRRVKPLYATDAGRAFDEEAFRFADTALEKVAARLSEAQITAAREVLFEVARALDEG